MVLIERMWFGTSIEYLEAGDWVRWTPGYYPGNAKNTSFSWSTDKPHVVSVDQTGKVQSNYNWDGPATITARAKDGGGAWASYIVDVTYNYMNSIKIDSKPSGNTLTAGNGHGLSVNYGYTGSRASWPYFNWSSSNPSVATVNGGTVWAHKAGTATITLSALDGSGKSASCKVTVTGSTSSGNNNNKVESISLNKSSVSLVKGKTTTLTATVKNAKNKTVTWSSSNTGVASVNSSGKITAKKAGTATITAKSKGGKTAKCTVTVTNATVKVTGVKLNSTSKTLNTGSSFNLTATVSPSNATNKGVSWSSSNTSVATVSGGKVTAKKAGTTTITVKTSDGGKTAKCNVTVKNKSKVSVNNVLIYRSMLEDGYYDNESYWNAHEDLRYSDKSKAKILEMNHMDESAVEQAVDELKKAWKELMEARTNTDEMKKVSVGMMDHFIEGSGEPYSNYTLTDKVMNHSSTQFYAESVAKYFDTYKGDFSELRYDDSFNVKASRGKHPFIKYLSDNGIEQPKLDTWDDNFNGLGITIHDFMGNEIKMKSYEREGDKYSATIYIKLWDHFGLDEEDINKFGGWWFNLGAGFRGWYILQHYNKYNGKYKPFVTLVEFDVKISGTIGKDDQTLKYINCN